LTRFLQVSCSLSMKVIHISDKDTSRKGEIHCLQRL
jgi:hypothetical protein